MRAATADLTPQTFDIEDRDGSRHIFVHISAVERAGMRTLAEGQRVSYDVVTERGKQAAANLQST
jgi:CspA family cold shock protein